MEKKVAWGRFLKISRYISYELFALRKFLKLNEGERRHKLEVPNHFVKSFIELGPTFIKIGQILSTRPDLIPKEYIEELKVLQENVPPFPPEQVKTMIQQEFGQPIANLFEFFEEKPVASASLSQVHLAVLKNGTEVAVKIQRPQIDKLVREDMVIISKIILLVSRIFPRTIRKWNLLEISREFERYTLQELDFTLEGKTLEKFAQNFAAWDDIVIPHVFWDYTTPKILTMERVSGLRLSEVAIRWPLAKRKALTMRLIEMEMKMFISDGFFHADLHPGNIFFTEEGKIILIDFGMYGELNDDHRDHFILYWLAAVHKQTKRAFNHLIAQTTKLKGADEESYYRKFKQLANAFYESDLSEVTLTQVYLEIIASGIKYGFVFPSDLILHAKAITTAEALTFTLVPNLKFEKESKPIIIREFAKRMTDIDRLKLQIQQSIPELLLFGELPGAVIREEAKASPLANSAWKELFSSFGSNLNHYLRNAAMLKNLLNPYVREELSTYHPEDEVDVMLNKLWLNYADLEPSIPPQESFGGETNVRLAAFTIALYQTLIDANKTPAEATGIIYEISWHAYSQMGDFPWGLAGIFSDHPSTRIRLAFKLFFKFPFSSPSYLWDWQDCEPNVVAFDCRKCPVAEYFKSYNLDELCVQTWCNLDYPLAKQWGATLERTGTIAGGAKVCDFRWRA